MKKGQTRIDGADDRIIGLYAAGLSVRDIQEHLGDLYGLRASPERSAPRKLDRLMLEFSATLSWPGEERKRMKTSNFTDA